MNEWTWTHLGDLVEFTEETVEHLDQSVDRQCHRQRREIDDIGVEDTHIFMFLQIQLSKFKNSNPFNSKSKEYNQKIKNSKIQINSNQFNSKSNEYNR